MPGNQTDSTYVRPEPVKLPAQVGDVKWKDDHKEIAEMLAGGEYVFVRDKWAVGLSVLAELKNLIFGDEMGSGFVDYKNRRSAYREASNRLLVQIRDNRIALKKSPEIEWLAELYPDVNDFVLPFPKVQGLNSSWQWYKNGIRYPGLKQDIHPWYGIYFPTRKDHIYLFNYWLKKYRGEKSNALDIGTGCGVLAFLLLENGFETVTATDINPNAIISVNKSRSEFGFQDRLETVQSDLFVEIRNSYELIVFNPPWLPARNNDDYDMLDKAIYFEDGLFDRFFTEAGKHLDENGKIILMFSNLGQTEQISDKHPVEQELQNHKRFKKVKLIRRKADSPSKKTKRRNHRKDEYVELWVLERA